MGILALDVSRFGVVMSADSQPVELLNGRNIVQGTHSHKNRNPIIVRRGGGFTGLLGFVGRERIEGRPTREWLQMFEDRHLDDPLTAYCGALAKELTLQWRRQRLRSGLWIFVSGVEGPELRFWFICNLAGLNANGTYTNPQTTFKAVDDLDQNYIARDLLPGQTKAELLRTRMYVFRNGVLRPTTLIFDAFSEIMQRIYAQHIPGFPALRSLDDLAFLDRQRMEFAKRLHSPQYGIAKATSPGIAGSVHVRAVSTSGEIREYFKHRGQVHTIL